MPVISYQAALKTLQPIIEPVCGALRSGLEEAVRYHAESSLDRARDEHFFSHHARRIARDVLRQRGLLHAEVDDDGNQMSSLIVPYQGLLVRILRRRVLHVPGPGTSEAWHRFWRQDQVPAFAGLATENLLWVWSDVDGVLAEAMLLARPTGSFENPNAARLTWRGKITEAMAAMRAEDLDELVPDYAADELGVEDTG
jgi:hypothetical protein